MTGARRIVIAALAALTLLGWWYLAAVSMPMPGPSGILAPAYLATSVVMWFLMMVAMMTPSVAPVLLLFDRAVRQGGAKLPTRTFAYAAGYFAVWLLFSVLATIAQVLFISLRWVDTMGVATQPVISVLLLAGVGLYQWSPAKAACLDHCRSPLHFITRRRRGPLRDLRAGAFHGAWCVGCCWALMLLLFAGGVMNLAWVAGLTILVALEKLSSRPTLVRRGIGVLALAAALAVGLRVF